MTAAVHFSSAPPEQGQLAEVRQRRYIVTDVKRSTLPVPASGIAAKAQHLVSLISIDDEGLGEELQVIWELEPGAKVHEKIALPEPTGFDQPARLDAFLDAVRWGASSMADTSLIQSPFRAGIEFEPYQLDPVVRAVEMPRVNLLVADDVGLGKTIETGMVLLELILRHRARRILVVVPASLQIKWQSEMRDKFGLEFRIVDSRLMHELRRTRGLHANPWTHYPRLITSIDFLKRERPLRLFREALPAAGQSPYPRRFDVLVIDEAHNVAPSGRGQYALDSLRTSAVRMLAPHFEHKLFLTATPHNGYPESFTALLELLDPQRFARTMKLDQQQLQVVMVRRLKSEITGWDGKKRFAERKPPVPLVVRYTPEEKEVHAALQEYGRLRLARIHDTAGQCAAEFILKLLKKRLFSSPRAFADTLARHEESLRGARRQAGAVRPSPRFLQQEFDRVDEDHENEEELETATAEALHAAAQAVPELEKRERELLATMRDWAQQACGTLDSKAICLIQWLDEIIRPNGQWSRERVIIFTEYRATQKWLFEMLASRGFTAEGRVMMLHGGLNVEERERIKNAFQFDPDRSPVRILIATDAASEGIDLQNHCHRLIHFEIPWNPNRMEQRNGRIDRHGQRASEVLVYHFVGESYTRREQYPDAKASELEEDLEFLMTAVKKVEAIREDLGKVGPVIAEQVEEAMLGRRKRLDTTRAERENEPVRRMLRFEQNVRERIRRLQDQLQETRRELRLAPENIESVVHIALALAGQPPLLPVAVAGIPRAFQVPDFRDPSWAPCLEGIYHPHDHTKRPIVFDAMAVKDRDDVVLAHLNHRLVQMCLRLLRAEIWAPEGVRKLHRVTARIVPDHVLDTPAVIAHARLVLVGNDSQRLHEEIISAGGMVREGRLSRMNVTQVQAALAAQLDAEPDGYTKLQLQSIWPNVAAGLTQALEARSRDRAAAIQKKLAERAGQEADKITNGEQWMLVFARADEPTGFATWHAEYWLEERVTLQAFRAFLGAPRFFAAPENESPEAMLISSADEQQEVTDQLGYQVRAAVEVLVAALDRADMDRRRELLRGIPAADLYEAALTAMMRLVFLLAAEERRLLPLGDELYDRFYAVSTLQAQLREASDQSGEEVIDLRFDAWSRLLATFRAVHGGVEHDLLSLVPYGGHLFDPDRFPFLEGRPKGTKWREAAAQPLPVSNRTVLHLLEALQYLTVRVSGGGPPERRRLSFRELDIEQIGHVYEGLLDHTARRAGEVVLGLAGTREKQSEASLAQLEALRARGGDALLEFLRSATGRQAATLARALEPPVDLDEPRFRAACGNDDALWERVRPFAALVRRNDVG